MAVRTLSAPSLSCFLVLLALHLGISEGCIRVNPRYTANYMTSLCRSGRTEAVLRFSEVTRLQPAFSRYSPNTNCTVLLHAGYYDYSRIQIELRTTDIFPTPNCSEDRLRIYEVYSHNGTHKDLTGPHGLCGRSFHAVMYDAATSQVAVKFTSVNRWRYHRGFDMIATKFYNGTCLEGDFKCMNGKCIPDALRCDNYNNCGDDSDEAYSMCRGCHRGCRISIAIVIIMLVIAAVIVITVLCCCCSCCLCSAWCMGNNCCRKRKITDITRHNVIHMQTDAPPTYAYAVTHPEPSAPPPQVVTAPSHKGYM